jgi:negative regulator of replication initiation
MSRLIATRVSDEHYSKIMGKCAGLGCSVYDYLKMLVETDISDAEKAKHVDEKKKQAERKFDETLERIRQQLDAVHSNPESKSVSS